MKPVKALARTISTLLAADTTYLASATAMKVGLITANVAPTLNTLMADLTISVATGLVALAGVSGAQNESIDPVTGELLVEVKPPAGGFRWETPAGFTGPTIVYGFALGNGAMTVLLGTLMLDTPITLNDENQTINAPPLVFRLDPTKIS